MNTLVIIDHRCAVQDGLKGIMAKDPEFRVEKTFGDLRMGLEYVNGHSCDVVIVGAPMFVAANRQDGLMGKFKRRENHRPLMVLYVEPHEEKHIYRDLAKGMDGHIRSAWNREETLNGLRMLVRDGLLLPRECSFQFAKIVRETGQVADTLMPLDEVDRQVGQGLVDGLADKEIGRRLKVSERTATRYKDKLFIKLGARNRAEAVTKLLSSRLLRSNGHMG